MNKNSKGEGVSMGINSIRTIKIEELIANKSMPNGMQFFVPKYQRGYRWKETQIQQMLNDLYEFEFERNNEEKFYCLQPLVVKKKEDGSWIVVDGQQRLTTIYIILVCIEKLLYKEKATIYTLNYENKPELWDCLDGLGTVAQEINIDSSDIDKYHITNCYRTIVDWLKGKNDLKAVGADIREKLRTYTRFIWYEINNDIEPEIIFSNINMGKIQLTNAELIKALLLKKDNYVGEKKEQIAGSQVKVSSAWDGMEAALQNDDFWLFLTGEGVFKNAEPRMELIFRIMTKEILKKNPNFLIENEEENNKSTYTFIIFNREIERIKAENKSGDKKPYSELLEEFWRNISDYFNMFQDWYNNREWYHLIGLLLAKKQNQNEAYFEELCDLYRENTKSDFVRELKNRIIKETELTDESEDLSLDDVKDYIDNLVYQNKEQEKAKIRNILLLFNVITMQENNESEPRFPFRRYKDQSWDIEHIHSVTSEKPQNAKERQIWIEDVWKFVEANTSIPDDIRKAIKDILDGKKFGDEFIGEYDQIYDKTIKFFSGNLDESEVINELSNLTLLDSKTNRSYKNAIFPIKRNVILSKSGIENFIPVCTKNVFLKYYSKDVTQMYMWGKSDRQDYIDEMVKTLYEYLKKDGEE